MVPYTFTWDLITKVTICYFDEAVCVCAVASVVSDPLQTYGP